MGVTLAWREETYGLHFRLFIFLLKIFPFSLYMNAYVPFQTSINLNYSWIAKYTNKNITNS